MCVPQLLSFVGAVARIIFEYFVAFLPFVMQLLRFPGTVASSVLEQFCILCF